MDRPEAPAGGGPTSPGAAPLRILLVNRHRADVLGGSEIQCDQIAAELARRGHAVTYAVRAPRRATYDTPYPAEPVPELADLARLLARTRPEVVYWRFNRAGLLAATRLAHAHGARMVLALSHDDDTRAVPRLSELWPPKRAARALIAAWNGRARAHVDGFIAQHTGQARGLPPAKTRVIHNSAFVTTAPFTWPRPYVAWVANLKPRKRPESFVALARALLDTGHDFLAVGALQDRRYAWLGDRARVPANFHWLGARPPEETNGVIAASELLVLTCEPEGFPNVLLQAWSLGRATPSLAYDPDALITTHALGGVSPSEPELATHVRALLAAPAERAAIGTRARTLVHREFSLRPNVDALEAFLREFVSLDAAPSDGT